MLARQEIESLLRVGSPWHIMVHECVGSTMDEARRLAEAGCDGFLAVIAEQQVSGTGRLDRVWHSSSGGLWMTVLFRPDIAPRYGSWFTLAAAVSVAKVLSLLGYAVGIKWPNDVLAIDEDHFRRKLCGIRAEMALEDEQCAWVSIGIGLNVTNDAFPAGLEGIAVSLSDLQADGMPSLSRCAALILNQLEVDYGCLQGERFPEIRSDWLDFAVGMGEEVALSDVDGVIHGRAVGLDDDGRLLVQEAACGPLTTVLSDDLIVRV